MDNNNSDSILSSSLVAPVALPGPVDNNAVNQLQSPLKTVKKRGNIANLKPYPKGVSGNKKGRPKGASSLPHAVDRVIDRKGAERIAETLVNTAMSGSVQAHRTLLELGGALKSTPQVAIQQNNHGVITAETIALALQYLKDNKI